MSELFNAIDAVDITNKQMVGTQGESVVLMIPRNRMTKLEALVHAAWLVSMTFATEEEFLQILNKVQNT